MDSLAFKVLDADYTSPLGQLHIKLSDGATAAHRVVVPDPTISAPGRVPKVGEHWRFTVKGAPGSYPGAVDEIVEIVDACYGFTCFASPLYGIVVVDPVGRPSSGALAQVTSAELPKLHEEISLSEWRRKIESMGSRPPSRT